LSEKHAKNWEKEGVRIVIALQLLSLTRELSCRRSLCFSPQSFCLFCFGFLIHSIPFVWGFLAPSLDLFCLSFSFAFLSSSVPSVLIFVFVSFESFFLSVILTSMQPFNASSLKDFSLEAYYLRTFFFNIFLLSFCLSICAETGRVRRKRVC
jgi:hypothetical protein